MILKLRRLLRTSSIQSIHQQQEMKPRHEETNMWKTSSDEMHKLMKNDKIDCSLKRMLNLGEERARSQI